MISASGKVTGKKVRPGPIESPSHARCASLRWVAWRAPTVAMDSGLLMSPYRPLTRPARIDAEVPLHPARPVPCDDGSGSAGPSGGDYMELIVEVAGPVVERV